MQADLLHTNCSLCILQQQNIFLKVWWELSAPDSTWYMSPLTKVFLFYNTAYYIAASRQGEQVQDIQRAFQQVVMWVGP